MYPFILVPKKELEQLSVHLNEVINSCLTDWSFLHEENITLDLDNAYELDAQKLLVYKEHIYQDNYIYITNTQSTQRLFYNLFCNSALKKTDDKTIHRHGEIFDYLLSETLDELFEATFGEFKVHTEDREIISYTELFKKGSGAIYLKLGIGDDLAIFILPRYIYEHLLPEKLSLNGSAELYEIDVDKIDSIKEINLNVSLNPTVLNINDLISLAEGDLLVLDHKTNMNLNLHVNNEVFTTCRLGKYEQYKAISLVN